MRLQTTDSQVLVLGKRSDGTFDGELEFKPKGFPGFSYKVPFYIEKHEDHNPPVKEKQ